MIDLARVIELPVAVPEVWSALWDVQQMAGCLPGCQDAEAVDPRQRYRATVRDRVGPYRVEIPIDVTVDELEAGTRLAVKASGRDTVLSSHVKVSMIIALAPNGAGTSLTLHGKAEVGGKLAELGRSVVQRKTHDVLSEFAANVERLFKRRGNSATV
jgi:carbon monoxide dehydrogenase subunit G